MITILALKIFRGLEGSLGQNPAIKMKKGGLQMQPSFRFTQA